MIDKRFVKKSFRYKCNVKKSFKDFSLLRISLDLIIFLRNRSETNTMFRNCLEIIDLLRNSSETNGLTRNLSKINYLIRNHLETFYSFIIKLY